MSEHCEHCEQNGWWSLTYAKTRQLRETSFYNGVLRSPAKYCLTVFRLRGRVTCNEKELCGTWCKADAPCSPTDPRPLADLRVHFVFIHSASPTEVTPVLKKWA